MLRLNAKPALVYFGEPGKSQCKTWKAEENKMKARNAIEQIPESLREIGLSESLLNQAQVQDLRR